MSTAKIILLLNISTKSAYYSPVRSHRAQSSGDTRLFSRKTMEKLRGTKVSRLLLAEVEENPIFVISSLKFSTKSNKGRPKEELGLK